MGKPIIHEVVQDEFGNGIASITVKVYVSGTTTFAKEHGAIVSGTLGQKEGGGNAIGITDECGRLKINVVPGEYDIEYSAKMIETYSQERRWLIT